ncbi:MAG: DUF1552 domain-containing protein [Planctomycetales bacterium]|nr:DUF1552 domain-containing protein [Planctomycetales bacterium]
MPRRAFLRATGVAIALPALESLTRPLRASESAATAQQPLRRMVCIGNEFGMYPGSFWPALPASADGSPGGATLGGPRAVRDYTLPNLLKPLSSLRDQLTLFGHLDHGLKGGHFAVHTYLTGVKSVEAKGMPDGGISLDQRAAEHVGAKTRFPALTIGSEDGLHGGCQMSWTRTGTRVPPIQGPRELFRRLFLDDDTGAKRRAVEQIVLQGSILDAVADEAQRLKRRISAADQQKLDEYFASVRDVETKLELQRHWQNIPKPQPPAGMEEPKDEGLAMDLPKIYDLIALALQTDSTRVATLEIGGSFVARDIGIRKGYHALSHHGKVQENIDQLVQIELYQVEQFARFVTKLGEIREPGDGRTLLEQTMVLFGSGMGNANSHTNHDLPVVLAGGGFRHGHYLVLPDEPRRRVPLCNLYLSMLQQFGVETDHFSNSTGTLSGLEIA